MPPRKMLLPLALGLALLSPTTAFAAVSVSKAELNSGSLRVEGSDNCLDFTAVADVADALVRLVERLHETREPLPPIHLVSGNGTTLRALADSIISLSGSRSAWSERASRNVTSPCVAAAAMANVAASMRSGITSCSAPCSSLTPVIVTVGLPAP